MAKKDYTPGFSKPVRIFCLVLSLLVAGGLLTYLAMLIMNIFG